MTILFILSTLLLVAACLIQVSVRGRWQTVEEVAFDTSVYDETPIHVYMQDIHQRVVERGRMAFSETFRPGMHKSALIGVFLAVLELVRHHSVEAEQEEGSGEIWVTPGPRFQELLDLIDLEDDDPRTPQEVVAS